MLTRPGAVALAIAAGTGSWLAQIAGIWAALEAFGIHAGLTGAALVFVATTIVQLFPFWPGNVGMFQLGVYAPLVQLCAVPASTAIAFGVGLQVVEALLGRRARPRLPRPRGPQLRWSTTFGYRRGGASRTAHGGDACDDERVTDENG